MRIKVKKYDNRNKMLPTRNWQEGRIEIIYRSQVGETTGKTDSYIYICSQKMEYEEWNSFVLLYTYNSNRCIFIIMIDCHMNALG